MIKELYKESVLARDFDGNYVFVGEKFKEEDSFNRLITTTVREIGYVDPDLFARIVQSPVQDRFTRFAEQQVKTGALMKVVFSDLRSLVYCEPASLKKIGNRTEATHTVSPKDLLYRSYESEFKKAFRGRNLHYLVENGKFLCAFTVRKSGRSVTVGKIMGDRTAKHKIKKELNLLGFSVYFSGTA